MPKKISLIAIVGQTASGKSELAIRLARRYRGEIIGVDSRQVYRNLAIGSNRVAGVWKHKNGKRVFVARGIPHHCIEITNPKRPFSVVDYKACADNAIRKIHQRGGVPMLAGGTGFYLQAVLDGVVLPNVKAQSALRKKLEKKSPEQLFALLETLDPARARHIDHNNPRRLMRAIEIIRATKKPVPKIIKRPRYRVLLIGIYQNANTLKQRIAQRVRRLLKKGLVKEVHALRHAGLSKKRIGELGFEYSLPLCYIEKRISKKELYERLVRETWRYAQRQMTWFRRDPRIHWVSSFPPASRLITTFLKKQNNII